MSRPANQNKNPLTPEPVSPQPEYQPVSTLQLNKNLLLLLSATEGACVMVAELAGGKMLAPYYGTSLYVWASTLAITLGGLAIGYFLGGRLSRKPLPDQRKLLFTIIAIASALVMVMPVWANWVMQQTLSISFLPGLVLSQLLFLLPPVLGMGMVSPLLINLLAHAGKDGARAGQAAGSVYAISTLGGVIATIVTGFWWVPLAGISLPCIVAGLVLFVINILVLGLRRRVVALVAGLLLIPSLMFALQDRHSQGLNFNVLYHKEGIMGQVKVVDYTLSIQGQPVQARSLMVNHIWQTWIKADDPSFGFLYYTRFTDALIRDMPQGSKALLIGLGGGTVARQMEQAGVAYDAVEIDGRLPELAQEFFGLKGTGGIYIDDGRHFINTARSKYDLIIIDALLGENVPSHLLSLECFNRLKELLQPGGKIFIEFDGIVPGTDGNAQSALLHTIRTAGYQCRTFGSIPGQTDGDMMYIASLQDLAVLDSIRIQNDAYYPHSGTLSRFALSLPPSQQLITDNDPVLDYLLRDRMVYFRQHFQKRFNQNFIQDDMAFFY
jgi:predicted membrane-bound spermidine synthase